MIIWALSIEAQRLGELLTLGAIDADDAQLWRRRYQDDPAAWNFLLDACEAAAQAQER